MNTSRKRRRCDADIRFAAAAAARRSVTIGGGGVIKMSAARQLNHSFWDHIERDSNVVPDACRSFYTTLTRSSYPNESGTPTSTPAVNVCPGARCSTITAHRASFVVIRTVTLLKLSSISNSRTTVTLVGVCVCVCVCVCICARLYLLYVCGIKETFVHLKCIFIKLWTHIGGCHYVSVTSGFRCVDFCKCFQPRDQKDPKPTRKGIALNLDQWVQMRARRGDIQRSSRFRHGATVLHARRPPRDVRMSRVLSNPAEARIKSSNPFVLEPYRKKLKTLWRMHVGVSTQPSHVRRIQARVPHLLLRRSSMSVLAQDVSTTTAHRASFVVIRTLTLLKLSSISNSRTIVTLVGVCVCVVCVCVFVRVYIYCMYLE